MSQSSIHDFEHQVPWRDLDRFRLVRTCKVFPDYDPMSLRLIFCVTRYRVSKQDSNCHSEVHFKKNWFLNLLGSSMKQANPSCDGDPDLFPGFFPTSESICTLYIEENIATSFVSTTGRVSSGDTLMLIILGFFKGLGLLNGSGVSHDPL